ncbi:MAG: LysE family transporter [Candidatus Bipolaricaulia bacterium]
MTLIGLFFTSFVVGLSGSLMPGPVTVATIRESYARGSIAGPLIAAGHSLLELPLVIGLAFGLSRLIQQDLVFIIIGTLGGLALLYFGTGMIRDVRERSLTLEQATQSTASPAADKPRLMWLGIFWSITNPYWVVWWLTIGASYILIALDRGAVGIPIFYFAHILSDILWLSLIAFAIAQGKRIISEKYYRGLIFVCGLFLVGLAGWFLYTSATTFLG